MLFLTVAFSSIQTASAIDVGILPIEVAINQGEDKVYVSNAFGGVFVFDTDGVPFALPIDTGPGALTGITVDEATDLIYVTNSGTNKVIIIDGSTDTLSGSIDLAPFGGLFPVDVEISTLTKTLYVSNVLSQLVIVIDIDPANFATTLHTVIDVIPGFDSPSRFTYDLETQSAIFHPPLITQLYEGM